MKTLVIIGVILAVLTLYFVVNADRSILVKGSEVLPAGTDIARLVLNKAKDLISQAGTGNVLKSSNGNIVGNIVDASYPAITDKIEAGIEKIRAESNTLIPKVIDKTIDLIKNPIENKINETFCSSK